MIEISKSALVPYSVERVFDVVNNVQAYPQFLPGCVGATVFEQTEDKMRAQLQVAKAGIKYAFTTCNELVKPSGIVLTLVDGPFRHFEGHWQFTQLAATATKIQFDLQFAMNSGLVSKAIEGVVADVSRQMVDAMCKQLTVLHGK